MMKYFLCRVEKTEISTFKDSLSNLCKHIEVKLHIKLVVGKKNLVRYF